MSTMLLTFFMISILLVLKLHIKQNGTKTKEIIFKLSQAFSFVEISDSKYIGLVIFLISNLLTGFVNLSINTLRTSDLDSFLILSLYCLVSFMIPFFLHYQFRFKHNEKIKTK